MRLILTAAYVPIALTAIGWVLVDSVYGERHLPGVADGPWGFLAMFCYVLAIYALTVFVSAVVAS